MSGVLDGCQRPLDTSTRMRPTGRTATASRVHGLLSRCGGDRGYHPDCDDRRLALRCAARCSPCSTNTFRRSHISVLIGGVSTQRSRFRLTAVSASRLRAKLWKVASFPAVVILKVVPPLPLQEFFVGCARKGCPVKVAVGALDQPPNRWFHRRCNLV
jgi:hypothetical protein